MVRPVLFFTAACALALPATALAQTASNRELAIIHYERGRALYAEGRYRQAVFELETAHSLDPAGTNLLLNLGTVHELGAAQFGVRCQQRVEGLDLAGARCR